jgi:hypothetical protein
VYAHIITLKEEVEDTKGGKFAERVYNILNMTVYRVFLYITLGTYTIFERDCKCIQYSEHIVKVDKTKTERVNLLLPLSI